LEKALSGDETPEEVFVLFEEHTLREVVKRLETKRQIAELIKSLPNMLKSFGVDLEAYSALENKESLHEKMAGSRFSDIQDFAEQLTDGLKQGMPANAFSDVNGKELQTAVEFLHKKGIIEGKSSGRFYPDDPITREEFAKLLLLSLGQASGGSQTEIKDADETAWYYPYVAEVLEKGYMQGTGDGFGVGRPITRQDVATVLYRILENSGAEQEYSHTFDDMESAAPYAKTAILYINGVAVMDGVTDSAFRPEVPATRAQVAIALYRIMQMKGGE